VKWPRITRRAYEDARKAVEELVAKNPALGDQFADALSDALDLIQAHPRQSPRLETNRTDHEVRRVVIARFNFLVIYRLNHDDPLVVAIVHASQDPDSWLTRDDS
jgi:plasmid stabilization system protein ParE